MAQQNINLGTPNNQDGDFVRNAWSKAQDNFTELYNSQSLFLGEYISLGALQTAHPTALVGNYANVDTGGASDVQRYLWDVDDTQWVLGGSGALEYQTEITSNENLTGTKKGLNKIYPVNSATPIVLTLDKGTYVENNIIIFERRDASAELISGNDTIIRGIRDGDNRFFIKDKFSLISLLCRGIVDSNLEWTIAGNLTRGYTGQPTVSIFGSILPVDTADVAIAGTGFSDNMRISISGNGTLNSFNVVDATNMTLNITSSGSEGDFLNVTMDNGDIATFINAIELTINAGIGVFITTPSVNSTWSPQTVNNSGATLRWTVTGDASGIYDANDPTIDLSGNTGTASIAVTSADDIGGLTTCRFTSLELATIDVTDWTACTELWIFGSTLLTEIVGLENIQLPSIFDLRSNGLTTLGAGVFNNVVTLKIEGNKFVSLVLGTQFSNVVTLSCNSMGTLTLLSLTGMSSLVTLVASSLVNVTSVVGLSTLTALASLNLANGGLTALDISSNVLLTNITVQNNTLNTSVVNNIILDADSAGLSSGTLNYSSNSAPSATENTNDDVLDAYNALITKSWTITGAVPV